jgi:hypothetical protein
MTSLSVSEARPKLEWFGHAAHFICGKDCRFHMATVVNGKWLVSTVGELWPSRAVREIHARCEDAAWLAANQQRLGDDFDHAYMQRFGYKEIGCNRKYETMVFRTGKRCASKECGCGLPEINGSELDFFGSNSAADAAKGHHRIVKKWSARKRARAHA